MIYGYARVSSKSQNLDRQLLAIREFTNKEGYPLDRIFTDKQTGKNLEREQYQLLRDTVSEGDTIIIKELDRLGRNKEDIQQELSYYKSIGVRVMILDIPTSLMKVDGQQWVIDMINNILIEVLGTIAQAEREKMRIRQAEGIALAKAAGKYKGRPKEPLSEEFIKRYKQVKQEKLSATDGAKLCGISRSMWYKNVRRYKEEFEVL